MDPPRFAEAEIPAAGYQLYDLGVADFDGDGDLDIWTANHTAEQSFLINDGSGNFEPLAGELFQEMDRAYPGLSDVESAEIDWPEDDSCLRIYFEKRELCIELRGRRRVEARIDVQTDQGFDLVVATGEGVTVTESPPLMTCRFAPEAPDDQPRLVRMRPRLLALPIEVSVAGLGAHLIKLGRDGSSPMRTTFTLALKDRHGHAWTDINGDGLTDLFIARGGLRGEIENHPEIRDELLLRTPDGWRDVTIEAGLEKHGCRARQAEWVDVDCDGLLDLWIRGEDSPDLLFRRHSAGETEIPSFEEAGAALELREVEDGEGFWFDAGADGDPDLFFVGETQITLYRNDREVGRFSPIVIAANPLAGERGTSRYGFGRPCAGDLEGDGDIDFFVASPLGSIVLVQEEGVFQIRESAALGLPDSCFEAAWVDADDDGDLDLHTVPDGLFLQDAEGRFAASGLLMTEVDETVTQARTIWFDMDGDGDMDALIATIGRDRAQGHHVGKIRLFRNEGAPGR
jgi:hypothetical protein